MLCCYGKIFTCSVAMVKPVALVKHAVDETTQRNVGALLLW